MRTAQFAHDNPKLPRNRRVGGNFLRSMLSAKNAQLFDQWCDIQNTARKLRNSVFSKHLSPLSTRPFPVAHAQYEFSEKHYMCLLRSACRQWPWNMHSVSADSCTVSFVAGYLCEEFSICCVFMLCIESMNSLVSHAGRLRSTVLMTS